MSDWDGMLPLNLAEGEWLLITKYGEGRLHAVARGNLADITAGIAAATAQATMQDAESQGLTNRLM